MSTAFRTAKFVTAIAAAVAALSLAHAQQTGALAPSQAVPQWSGQSGASGHPQMTAEAIRAAAADFSNCIERMWPEAAKRGVSRASFINHTAALTPDLRIMDLLDAQPEFVRPLWDYLDGELTDERMTEVRAHLKACRGCFPHFDFEKEFLEAIARSKGELAAPEDLRRKVVAKLRKAGLATS